MLYNISNIYWGGELRSYEEATSSGGIGFDSDRLSQPRHYRGCGDGDAGKDAVQRFAAMNHTTPCWRWATVVMNRVDSPFFPDNIEDVLNQPHQFARGNRYDERSLQAAREIRMGKRTLPSYVLITMKWVRTRTGARENCMWFGENMASTTQKGYNSFRFDSALGGVRVDAAQSVY